MNKPDSEYLIENTAGQWNYQSVLLVLLLHRHHEG